MGSAVRVSQRRRARFAERRSHVIDAGAAIGEAGESVSVELFFLLAQLPMFHAALANFVYVGWSQALHFVHHVDDACAFLVCASEHRQSIHQITSKAGRERVELEFDVGSRAI